MSDGDSPNVVVVCCDDLGYGDLGCYGADFETPNVDRLAAAGARFTDWHATAPVCSPSRASLLTGLTPREAGLSGNAPSARPETDPDPGLPPEIDTLADYLDEAGYATGAFGKWHLGMTERDDPTAHGFEDFFGFRSGCVDYYSHTFVWRQHQDVPPYHDLWEGTEEVWANGAYLTDEITDRAVEHVEAVAGGEEPFFTYVAYNAPHYPLHAPAEYFERFPDLDAERRAIAAMVAAVDDGVGAILDALERTGVAEDTIVVFTSDHGPSREVRNHLDGSRAPFEGGSTGGLRGHKFSLFEGGIRVPCIVCYPGVVEPGERGAFATHCDLVPTLLEYCGDAPGGAPLGSDGGFDGESVRACWESDAETPHERFVWTFGDQAAIREGDLKLTLNAREVGDDPPEAVLADLDADPAESRNLAGERPARAEELATALRSAAPDPGPGPRG